jgi:medium-chain acyl-[acyl-carrier-protein] hydrolase
VHLFVASYCAPQALGRPLTVPAELDALAAASVQQAHALSSDMAVEMVGVMRAALLADKAICEGYRYVEDEPLQCPISAFRGSEDYVQPSQMEAWRELTHGPFTTRTFLGDHFFLRDTPRGLQQAIRRTLARLAGT